jgi:hypothetical protein
VAKRMAVVTYRDPIGVKAQIEATQSRMILSERADGSLALSQQLCEAAGLGQHADRRQRLVCAIWRACYWSWSL